MLPDPPIDTLDPEALQAFLEDLRAGGFEPSADDASVWTGPAPASLAPITTASTLQLVLRDGWPYLPPRLDVDGVQSWHANRDHLCLWQEGDNTKVWVTLAGILARIEEWVEHEQAGFVSAMAAALDPHLCYGPLVAHAVGIDVDELVDGAFQDGQHGFLHVEVQRSLPVLRPGKLFPKPEGDGVSGRWFYRSSVMAPPSDLVRFEAALTDNQRSRYEADLARRGSGIYVLIWPTPHGHAPLVLHVEQTDGGRVGAALEPLPTSTPDRLRRAGPDAAGLQAGRVVILGVGAIGSHVAALLARSGVGHLTLVDGDFLYPPGQVRHAAEADALGDAKSELMRRSLRHFDWTAIEVVRGNPWTPRALAEQVRGFDLCVEATGLAPFTELVSRVAATAGVALVSSALYRGGAIARVRRQAEGDTAILDRHGWRYPAIPPGQPEEEYVGVEVGCAAPIHNAPPTSVSMAASLASVAAIDVLTGRSDLPDEIIEVIEPREPPFHRRGRLRVTPPSLLLTDEAAAVMGAAALSAHPNETGGLLLGIYDDRLVPVIARAVELPPHDPSPTRYVLPAGATHQAIDNARLMDARLGYLGEWHSHPTDQPASAKDRSTMRGLAQLPDVGTPILLVARPSGDGYQLDGYLTVEGELRRVDVLSVGPLPDEET